MGSDDLSHVPRTRERRMLAVLSGTTLALLAACGLLLWRLQTPRLVINTQAALADPDMRAEIARTLARDSAGVWDSHNDPEVARVIQAGLKNKSDHGAHLSTNSFGLREKQFALPKPAGTLRIVLLGDSYLHGYGVEADERAGALLERALADHAPRWQGAIECLHVAVGAWNALAECAYLRRTLSQLAPDLVVHVLVTNDLDDQPGVRGFGMMAAHGPLVASHTDALVIASFPAQFTRPSNSNYLLRGIDLESRGRYEALAQAVDRLAGAVRRSGARYLLVAHWSGNSPRLWRALQGVLRPEEFCALPDRLGSEPDLILAVGDGHWSRKGHELVMHALYAQIRRLGLLPELELEPWPEVEGPALLELDQAWTEASQPPPAFFEPPAEAVSDLQPARFTELEWRHVYTGLDDHAQVSPYASFYLARKGQATLHLIGRALAAPELAGARVRVSLEGVPVGELELAPGQPFDLTWPVPSEAGAARGVNVRLETSDYVYAGANLQHCVSFVLERLALE